MKKRQDDDNKTKQSLSQESVEQCAVRLRDAYMTYKDLANRCLIDIKQNEKGQRRVFYFKPDTFMLDEPDKQRNYREKLMKKITQVPHPEPIQFMGDELHKQLLETIQDRSDPTIARKTLAQFFKRRQYKLQHKKYKLLIRWAHNALTTEYMERLSHEATFKYGKLEYDMENALNRCERLESDEDFGNASTYPRPQTKAKDGGSLYIEKNTYNPVSSIRMDDVDVFQRIATYDQKINKLVNKYLARLKWLPLQKRYEIFYDAVDGYYKLKNDNISRQQDLVNKIRSRVQQLDAQSYASKQDEISSIIENYYVIKRENYYNKNKMKTMMQSIKADHEQAPFLLDNSIELKIMIGEKAIEYGIYGDIELDSGYSFTYSVTTFFPTYFQRQVIKSQFSLYDAFAGDEYDINNAQKRNLQNMVQIDTNILKDISTNKHNIPSQSTIMNEKGFQNIKVIRLKSCAYWIDYVCVQPKLSNQLQIQAAFLSTNNPIDTLLKSAMNFLDVNDLGTTNRILEEAARVHSQQQKNKPEDIRIQSKQKASQIHSKNQSIDQKANLQDEPYNLKAHFLSALRGDINLEQSDPLKDLPNVNMNSLKFMPQHLLQAYYILRHMKSRDYKIKLLYCLNYFRAIQKRMMLDLREFGTRERILGDVVQPLIPAEEASRNSQFQANAQHFKQGKDGKENNLSQSSSENAKYQTLLKLAEDQFKQNVQYSVNQEDQEKEEINLIDMKKYKFKGRFCNKIYSTCPVIPRFHATFGEPIEHQPINIEMERIGIKHATNESIRLMGRVDHIELQKENMEVYIKDDYGIYILYECVLQDMKDLEVELLKIGSFYISKHEFLVNSENEKPYPLVDRLSLLEDLLDKELSFQFQKVQLIQCYMEAYEHISDPLEQQRLIQIIVDMMAQRPRLNIDATYFKDSYDAEILCLQKHQELLRTMIFNQMTIEREENKRTQSYLDLTYRIANEQLQGKWTYTDAEDFFNELQKRKQTLSQRGKDKKLITDQDLMQSSDNNKKDNQTSESLEDHLDQQIGQKKYNTRFSQENRVELNSKERNAEEDFATVLGLPPITIETLYLQYKEKDETMLEIINENANYIKVYEGYPDFMMNIQGLNHTRLTKHKFSEWSVPINILDFYESLGFVTKFYATIQSIMTELQEVLKPHDSTLLTMIELKVLERAYVEYQKVRSYIEGDLQEYKGNQYIEDEGIVGNSDKISFYIKDMVSHLSKVQKHNINHFLICKLDLESINSFDFTQQPKEENPYMTEKPQLKEDMEVAVKIANDEASTNINHHQRFFPQLKDYMKKINIPSMLNLYCNSIEMQRLRQELIFAISESVLFFDNHLNDKVNINYVDEGPGKFVDYDIAIMEFDTFLKSNLNFRNADAVKMLICPSGLEELRAVLHYQLMQKQLLTIGVRMNQLLIDTQMRALNELELAKKGYLLPNMIINTKHVLQILNDNNKQSSEAFQKERYKYQCNLISEAGPVFYQVCARKQKFRSSIIKKFSIYKTQVQQSNFTKTECKQRTLRAYKIKLLHAFCKEVMKEAYHDAMKIQAISTCQKLRLMSKLFQIDESILTLSQVEVKPQIFRYEQSEFMENIFSSYNPTHTLEHQSSLHYGRDSIKDPFNPALQNETAEILDYFMIPSTITLAKCESINYQELQVLTQKNPSFDFESNPDDNNIESSIRNILPKIQHTMQEYPKDSDEKERQSIRVVDFNSSYDYTNCNYGRMFTYYALLERIFTLEYFIVRISSNLLDALKLEHCVLTGQRFWPLDQDGDNSIKETEILQGKNEKLAEAIINQIAIRKRAKIILSDDIINLSQIMNNIINKIQNSVNVDPLLDIKQTMTSGYLSRQKINEYLITYQEFRYYFILHIFDKLIDSYQQKSCLKEVKFVNDAYNELIKKDHIKVTFSHNSFHINSTYTRPEMQSLETSNLYNYYGNQEETIGFQSTVQPIINENAMAPPQITLYEGIYKYQKYKTTQFAGQIPNYPRVYRSLQTALINLSDQEKHYIHSLCHTVNTFLKEYLEVIYKTPITDLKSEILDLDNLKKFKRVLYEFTQARQLKNALICWYSCSTFPLDTEEYINYYSKYRNDVFWKILNEKDQIFLQTTIDQNKTTPKHYKGDQQEINRKVDKNMLDNIQSMDIHTQVLYEQVVQCKAEISVLPNEIEKQIIKASIIVLENETSAIANCYQTSVKQIDMHIHPFQQFASTCYQEVNPNSHLDLVTKLSEVQKFITKLRNRGTEVETLTSGPGIVFTIKDFNECIQNLCRGIIKYGERELRYRSEEMAKKEEHYVSLLYGKDRKIESLEKRIENTKENLDKLINSKMYEKGSQMIYEIDCVNRQLRLFKDNIYALKSELKQSIQAQFVEKLKINMRDLDISWKRFKDFKDTVTSKVKADLAQEQHNIQKVIKQKAEDFKNLTAVPKSSKINLSAYKMENQSQTMEKVTSNQQIFSSHLEELNKLTEREARDELAYMVEYMRKMRIFWKTKEVIVSNKYEKEISTLKKQLTSNACLWEQLAECEKREMVMKQELIFAQQALGSSEKVIEKLQEDLRKTESDRQRLNQYKTNKQQRLEELEEKVRKYEVSDNINLEKIIDTLSNKEKEIIKLRDLEKNFNQRVDKIEKKKDNEIKGIKDQYYKEVSLKKDVLDRLEGLRLEIRMMEKNEGSMADIWKSKCRELVDICNVLKQENDVLRDRVVGQSLNTQKPKDMNLMLLETNNDDKLSQTQQLSNNNLNQMLTNIESHKYGSATRQSHNLKKDSYNYTDFQQINSQLGMPEISPQVQKSAGNSTTYLRSTMYNNNQSNNKLSEHSMNRRSQNNMNGSQIYKTSTQRFGLNGNQAQISHNKVHQILKTQLAQGDQIRQNEDINKTFIINNNQKVFREGMVHMSNTSTQYSKNFGSGNHTTFIGKSPERSNIQSQDFKIRMQSANRNFRNITERYDGLEIEKKGNKMKKLSTHDVTLQANGHNPYNQKVSDNQEEPKTLMRNFSRRKKTIE